MAFQFLAVFTWGNNFRICLIIEIQQTSITIPIIAHATLRYSRYSEDKIATTPFNKYEIIFTIGFDYLELPESSRPSVIGTSVIGIETLNCNPYLSLPISLLTQILPPKSSTIFFIKGHPHTCPLILFMNGERVFVTGCGPCWQKTNNFRSLPRSRFYNRTRIVLT